MGATLLLAAALALSGLQGEGAPARPATISFEHDGRNVTGFALYATRQEDGWQRRFDVGLPASTADGLYRVALPALEDGTWRIQVAAYNAVGESSPVAAEGHLTVGDPESVRTRPGPAERTEPARRPDDNDGMLRKLWRIIVG